MARFGLKGLKGWVLFTGGIAAMAVLASFAQVTAKDRYEIAIFAGGCFWCMEEAFDKAEGVVSTTSGYTGGHRENPTYRQVITGKTGHVESVLVRYDPRKISYEELLKIFWHNIDPIAVNGQFCDIGSQYRACIFYINDKQRELAEVSKAALKRSKPFKEALVTDIVKGSVFYPAEEYHQDFYKKNPVRYKLYKFSCGRDKRLRELWG